MQMELETARPERFRKLMRAKTWSDLEHVMRSLVAAMRGRVLWNVNSTARGGGVAEMLASLIPYERGAGIDERWVVIEGSPGFFAVTKKLHSMLHGVEPEDGALTAADRRNFTEATAPNADALVAMVKPGDVVILHDPQPAGLAGPLADHGAIVIWRCHIGVDEPNDVVRDAWRFLLPDLAKTAACVFSRRAYVWEGLDNARVSVIPPCIDPFATKNVDLMDESTQAILTAGGFISGSDGQPTFVRRDGTRARVVRHADLGGVTLPHDARIVTQVSRWDRLKDPHGVMESFARYVAPATDAYLVLAGPAATSVTDDPEQPKILNELHAQHRALPTAIRDRVVIAQVPMEDTDENAAMVNALQRRSDVVVQKSLAEGFGLTVAEAMWKGRPVVASRAGGIGDQIEDGRSGLLIDDPRDLEAFGSAVVRVLGDRDLAARLGDEARHRVVEHFITPCHLSAQARLVTRLLA